MTDAQPPNSNSAVKPKTSHTTIERRYRTNLNARIQSLRAAVPALRVLEQKDGNRVGNLGLKAGTRKAQGTSGKGKVGSELGPGEEDVVDERGFVDGVKVARKGSKANVLGKAVEYIRYVSLFSRLFNIRCYLFYYHAACLRSASSVSNASRTG